MADLNGYFTQMRDHEKSIPDEFPIVVSHKTGDGGVAGRLTEVTRRVAARLLVEGAAHLADIVEAENFRKAKQVAKASVESMAASAKLEFAVSAAAEVQRLAQVAAAAVAAKE